MKMKNTLAAATVAVLGMTGAAKAADIYSPGLKDVPYVAVPSWTGFYLGAHVGGAWGDLKTTDSYAGLAGESNQWSNNSDGIVGGGQLGYNYQVGSSFVVGFEADFGGLGLSQSQTPYGYSTAYYSKLNDGFYADATARLGYAVGPALFYVKGGWAYFDGGLNITDTAFPASVTKKGVDGWVIGGGIEYKFTPNWGVKGEYRYFDFSDQKLDLYNDGTVFKQDLKVNTVTLGVNYYVGNAYSPLK
jgi:outer membrane immunogenic protein